MNSRLLGEVPSSAEEGTFIALDLQFIHTLYDRHRIPINLLDSANRSGSRYQVDELLTVTVSIRSLAALRIVENVADRRFAAIRRIPQYHPELRNRRSKAEVLCCSRELTSTICQRKRK